MATQRARLYTWIMFASMTAYICMLYPGLPDRIPVHWNLRGEIDGWGPKSMLFLGPGLILFSILLLHALPGLSPRKFEIDTFKSTFNQIMVIVAAMFTCISYLLVHAAQGRALDMSKAMMVVISLFMALLGNLLGKVRKNFYVGVRTPWTLASDNVWNATHRVAGRWMVAGGILSTVVALLGGSPVVCIGLIMVTSLYPVLFSYTYYRRLERTGGL